MKPDKIYLSLSILIILTTISWITSCTHVANIANFPEICFDKDVLPIFVNSCAMPGSRCHNGQGESRLNLNSYTDISRNVVPGNPDASRVYKAIIAKGGENKMPPGQPLSLENRTVIRLWIEQGAQWTVCPDTTITPKRSGHSINSKLYQANRVATKEFKMPPSGSDNLKYGLITTRYINY